MPGRTVAVRYVGARLTVPAATPENAPHGEDVSLGRVELVAVHVTVPRGHAGLTGLAVTYAGTRIVPWDDPGEWVVADGAEFTFDIGIEVGGPVRLSGFNLDVYDHTFHLRLQVADLFRGVEAARAVPVVGVGGAG